MATVFFNDPVLFGRETLETKPGDIYIYVRISATQVQSVPMCETMNLLRKGEIRTDRPFESWTQDYGNVYIFRQLYEDSARKFRKFDLGYVPEWKRIKEIKKGNSHEESLI